MLYTKSIKYPETFNLISGKTDLDEFVVSINRCLGLLLTTAKGELLGDPDFGCKLYEMLFDHYNENFTEDVKQEIVDEVTKFEKRINITKNNIDIKENTKNGRNSYTITIRYTVKNSTQQSETQISVEERELSNG